ncbi:MAG: ACP S-malonyltransferase [Desulfobacterales bacterium]|jgi:[acyl-carrier-protein] S-malonyltransferase|nr:ACP S-malonyltransferase [Desulfobacterales bacterium]
MKPTACLFPGQGSQSVGMGEDFYREFDFVRETFDMMEEITRIHVSRLCFKGPMEELTQTVHLQPALTAINLACLQALRHAGFDFSMCAGHSLGEYSALHAAGVVRREDAARLVFRRGELMHREAGKHQGAMQAIVGLTLAEVEALVAEGATKGVVAVANHNMETQIVITGSPEAVARVGGLAAAKGAKAVPLKVSGAWHSELIRGAEAEFKEVLAKTSFQPPQKKVVLNVTAADSSDPAEIREIMSRQLCSPVRWYDSMLRMKAAGIETFVEVGPGKVLSGLLRKILPKEHPARIFNVGSLAQLEEYLKAAG